MQDAFQRSGLFPDAANVFTEVTDVRVGMPVVTAHALSWAMHAMAGDCLLYTSDAADERSSVDLGGCRIIQKKKKDEDGGLALVR